MSCTLQGLKIYCPMKTSIKKTLTCNDLFSRLSNAALSKDQQKKLKGGDDSIIIVEVLEG